MRSAPNPLVESFRVTRGALGSNSSFGNNGAFFIRGPVKGCAPSLRGAMLKVIASDGEGWEHVSVSLPTRCPTWEEMSLIKDLFWSEDECVVQYHPPKSEYVNYHPFCLHLWRPVGQDFILPPRILVGPDEGTAA